MIGNGVALMRMTTHQEEALALYALRISPSTYWPSLRFPDRQLTCVSKQELRSKRDVYETSACARPHLDSRYQPKAEDHR
jgi:hypothetical protein